MTYFVGQRATLRTTVLDEAGTPTDATVVLTVTAPDGTVTTPSVSHAGTGQYTAEVTFDQAGDWLRVWTTTGTIESADSDQVHVIASALRIVGLAEVKEHGNITSTSGDRELLDFIGTAQQMIEDVVGAVVPAAVTDRFRVTGRARVWLTRIPVLTVASVQEVYAGVAQSALDPAEYQVDTVTGALTRLRSGVYSYWSGHEVLVTYTPGRAPIPEAIRWAAKELTVHLWRSTQSLRGGRGRSTGGEDLALIGAGYGLPNRVADALQPFLKPPAVY